MDVTSLLNASSGAKAVINDRSQSASPVASDRSNSGSSTEPRTSEHTSDEEKRQKSRTPWNADGYSLPLSIDIKTPLHLKSRFRSPSERLDSPGSGTESGASAHSRAASMDSSVDAAGSRAATPASNVPASRSPKLDYERRSSTAVERSDSLAHDPAIAEKQNSERSKHKFSDSHSSLSSYASSVSGYHSRISSVTTVSGITIETPLADSKLGQLPESIEVPTLGTIQPPSPRFPGLQQSVDYNAPSSNGGASRLLSPTEMLNSTKPKADSYFAPSKFHKRTVSAPNCGPTSLSARLAQSQQSYPVLPPPHSILDQTRRQETPEMSREQSPVTGGARIEHGDLRRRGSLLRHDSEHEAGDFGRPAPRRHSTFSSYSDHSRSVSLDPTRAMSQAPAPIPEHASTSIDMALNAEACCMFVENCNTGSQLRKAISHLFGRNKNCTQRIPKHVWVYYCRKHYQRVRYRNAKTYPLTQMELVKVQIHRLQGWSAENRKNGHGSYIESWEFSLRKREQKRLDGEAGPGDDSEDENVGGQGSTGVPSWIVQRLGKGYGTDQVLDIVDRLYSELDQGRLAQVPEVEFLPNIVEEGSDGVTKPGRSRRNNSTTSVGPKTPKRKASDVSMIMEHGPPSHPGYVAQYDERMPGQMSPSEKRMRVDRVPGFSPPRVSDSFMRPIENLPSRPASSNRYMHGAEQPLPRAPHVVPKMNYGQNFYGGGPEEDRQSVQQMRYPFSGHAGPEEQGRAYFYELSSTYGHMPPQPEHGHEGTAPQFNLPSMMPQMSGHPGGQRPAHRSSSMAPSRYGPQRPMHQRSASAFTIADRRGHPYSRPSSSGPEGQVGHHGFEGAAPGFSGYGMDAPRAFLGSHGPRQHGHSQSLSMSHSPFHPGAHPMMHAAGHRNSVMGPDVRGRR
ncbi:hypothetical protein HJFPF1_03807 [Paramyrothecium foliicola]|nr:hypothetical protein HJFPF1_03807 [Paramyrothecium foliicola]